VRFALRNAREQKGLTQGQVANEMDWSLSKVMRIESGEVSISTGDLRMLLPYLGIKDPDEVNQLLADAKASRRQRWVVEPDYREHLSPALLELMQLETDATAIRYFHPVLIPGLLQTQAYASAIFKSSSGYIDVIEEAAAKVRLDARIQRRKRVLDRPKPPDYLAILDESVLHRVVGGPAVMHEQLVDLLEVMRRRHVWIRIIPFAAGPAIALLGPFIVLEMDDVQDAVLYREEPMTDEIVRSRRTINDHRNLFERLWSIACGDAESARIVEKQANAMAAATDSSASAG
jgi:transcriptional regulator with XRE-family HTH domain